MHPEGLSSRFSRLWRERRLMTLAFLVALAVTMLMAARLTFSVLYWQAHADLALEPWMRFGYVARSHGVEVEGLRAAAGLAPEARDRRTLAEIALEQAIPVEELIRRLDAEIARQKVGAAPDGPSSGAGN